MKAQMHDFEYLNLVDKVLRNGVQKGDRTGTGTLSLPFQQMRFNLSENSIPLLTTKKMFTRGIIHEILWYLKGDTNIKYLNDHDVHIWDGWADENGDLGPIYGAMWRCWPGKPKAKIDYAPDPPKPCICDNGVDQIANAIDLLKNNPNDRRIIVNAWNPAFLPDTTKSFSDNVADGNQALPPCHAMFQFWANEYSDEKRMEIFNERYPTANGETNGYHNKNQMFDVYNIPKGELRCHLYQRSCDVGLGVPFNIVQYSILTHMIAQVTNLEATEFVWTGGDVHIYNNHIEQLNEQMENSPYCSPKLKLNVDIKDIDDFTFDDFEIQGYEHHPTIKMDVSI